MSGKKKNAIVHLLPLLIIIAVVGSIAYVWNNHSNFLDEDLPTTSIASVSRGSPKLSQQVSAVVTKRGSELQLSVAALHHKDIQKVEFYVEDQFVGAAYSEPYSISLKESDLSAGNHMVKAKIVTSDSTTSAIPATFSTKVSAPSTSDSDTSANPVVISTPATNRLSAPGNVTAAVTNIGTSVIVSWDASDGATGYQIWRDGEQIAQVTSLTYTDTKVTAGQTYSYQVQAVDNANNSSDLSDAQNVTIAALTSNSSVTPPQSNSVTDQNNTPSAQTSQ